MDREQLLKELKQDLLREIPNAVKKIKLDKNENVCYISLLGTDDENVLGLIQLGIESYRDKIIEKRGINKHSLWNSGNMPIKYQIGIESVYPEFSDKQEKLKFLFGYIEDEDGEEEEDEDWEARWEACQTLRYEVAYELNSFNWSVIMPVTDDFVVFSDWEALDVENGDLIGSLPLEKLHILTEKGFI